MISPANTQSVLLDLPGELRNVIYRYGLSRVIVLWTSLHNIRKALVERLTDVSTRYGFQEPGLLKTCKSVRADEASIYYVESNVVLYLVGMKTNVLVWWEAKTAALARENIKVPRERVDIVIEPLPLPKDWARLEERVERYRLGEVTYGYGDAGILVRNRDQLAMIEHRLLEALFAMAKECGQVPAAAFKRMLALQRKVLGRVDTKWLD